MKKEGIIESVGFNKQGDYVRYFYDNIGQIIGRVETDEVGDSKAFDAVGNYLGMTYDGKTFNQAGEIVAHSDILSSLLVREEKVMAMKKKELDTITQFQREAKALDLNSNSVEDFKLWITAVVDKEIILEKLRQKKEEMRQQYKDVMGYSPRDPVYVEMLNMFNWFEEFISELERR